jgi:hypothetical protein
LPPNREDPGALPKGAEAAAGAPNGEDPGALPNGDGPGALVPNGEGTGAVMEDIAFPPAMKGAELG